MTTSNGPTRGLDGPLHYDSTAFMAHRYRTAQAITVDPPQHYALPGALVPINVDRLKAHQESGSSIHEIVKYENERFMASNAIVRAKHAAWVNGTYDAMVKVEKEMKAERLARELEAAAEYKRRVEEMLARKTSAS